MRPPGPKGGQHRAPSAGTAVGTEGKRLALPLVLSVLAHMLLLSLIFGGQGFGLPGFGLPWQERRIEAPDLRVVLVPAQSRAAAPAGTSVQEPTRQAPIGPPVTRGPAPAPFASTVPIPGRAAEAIVPEAEPTVRTKAEPDAATGAIAPKAPLRSETSGDATPTPTPEPAVVAMPRSDEAPRVAPAAAPVPTPAIATAPGASSPQTTLPVSRDADEAAQERIDVAARQRAVDLAELDRSQREAQRQAVQLEAARIETARLEAERQEGARLEAVRQEASRQEATRREAERAETAQQEAEREEATRQAATRQEAARQEAAQQEAQRAETARLDAERQEAARQETARQGAARVDAEREDAARREAARRAMGRQLDEEAARREAAATAARLPSALASSSSGARRGRLFGRSDPNAELVLYAEAWARKIELNMTFEMVRDVAKRPHTHPMVTVAIRSDGSVESVTFVLSSGVAQIDEAIRRIVQSQLPYQAFPPGLARDYDVIEIRRTWHFDTAVRLY